MSISPTPHLGPIEDIALPGSHVDRRIRVLGLLLGIALVVGISEGFYAWWLSRHLQSVEQKLQSQIATHEQTILRLSDRMGMAEEDSSELRREVSTTKDHLGSTQGDLRRTRQLANRLAEQQKQSTELLSGQLGQLQQEQEATKGTVGAISTDVTGVKQEVNATRNELASTRTELHRVVGDLGVQSDLIARNREELAELRLRGERDYYEFDLRKTKQPQRVGEAALLLKKTDLKRQKFTFDLIVDDRRVEKKDKTVNEPVQFYQDKYRQPTEIVVNQIFKDRIVGYISAPKKKEPRFSVVGSQSPASGSGS